MHSFKFKKAIILGMILTTLSTGAAFTNSDEPRSTAVENQQSAYDNDLLQKHREIDQYVFELHAEEIKQKGFNVTHTGPVGSFIEIGINPYNEENANYLYKIFGTDKIKVVEGQQAVTFAVGTDTGNSQEIYSVTSVMTESKDSVDATSSTLIPILGGLGLTTLLGGTIVLTRKLKSIRK